MYDMEKLMVYIPQLTRRAEYIFSLILKDLIGAEIVITDRRDDYNSYSGPRIEYSTEPSGNGIFLHCHHLLMEQTIEPQTIELFTFNSYPVFFPVHDDRSTLPFDIFAASFYLVTRYEEYLPFKPDRAGRYDASTSIANKGNFLTIPIVNLWANLLKDNIREVYPSIRFLEKKFHFVPTIDIDHAYAYKQRTLYRTIGGYGRSLLEGNLKNLLQRTKVLLNIVKDPFDQYDYIREIHERCGLKPLYFFLFADYGKDDNNVSLSGKTVNRLLIALDEWGTLGIHPSLTSGINTVLLHSEIQGLAKVLGHRINISRQHFLKVSFPITYRLLIENGITDDYSMGYAGSPGFRAGIADPFHFFDLESNRTENLVIHPVTLMDVTLNDYFKLTPGHAIELSRKFIDAIKAVEGEFISVWHNESFDEANRWKGWRAVYNHLLSYTFGKL